MGTKQALFAGIVAGVVVSLAGSQAARATVISFDPLAVPGPGANTPVAGFNDVGSFYQQDGFTFTGSGGYGPDLGGWLQSDPNLNYPVGGSAATSLTTYYALATLSIAPNSGTFGLQSVDLAQWGYDQLGQAGNSTFSVTFDGHKAGGGDVFQTFTVANTSGESVLATYSFSGFTDLTEVTVQQGIFPGTGTSWQLNNLDVNAVPEPSIWALMLLGFAGLGCMAVGGSRSRRSPDKQPKYP
jgi:hypothetical protein